MATNTIPPLHLVTERQADRTFVHCAGQVDADTWSEFSATVRLLLAEGKPIRVDLAHVTRVDSTGIGALVGIWTAAKRRNCDLKYTDPGERLREIVRTTGLLGMIEGHEAEGRRLDAALGRTVLTDE